MSGGPVITRMLAATLALALAASPSWGQSKTGTTIGAFLEIEPSARIAGMGNAGVALGSGLDGVYYNAAAIGRIERFGISFSHSAWLADISHDYVVGAFPLGKWGNTFVSVTALNSGDIDVRTENQPLGTGEVFRVSDVAIGLGYGMAITDRFTGGIQINYLQETIWHSSMSAATVSIGTLYRTSEKGFHLGASLSNFGTQGGFSGRDLRVTYDQTNDINGDNSQIPAELYTDQFSVPVVFRVGVGKPFHVGPSQWLNLEVDAFHPNDNTESVSVGAEYDYRGLVAARVGYQGAFVEDSETGLTAGGGFRGKLDVYAYRFDYAWADHGRLGGTHRFSFGLEF